MKSETIKKINTFGRVGYILCKIGKIAVIIAAIACLVGGILMYFVPRDTAKIELKTSNSAVIVLNEDFAFSGVLDLEVETDILQIGDNTYKIVPSDSDEAAVFTSTVDMANLKWICFSGMVVCISVFFVFFFAEKLCRHFKDCETPFTEDIARQLTNLAWSLIPTCVLAAFIGSVMESLLMGTFKVMFSLDLITVLLILCVFMLSYIFKHGAALQTESDELL